MSPTAHPRQLIITFLTHGIALTAGSRWALDQITDPTLKKTAEGWRQHWEKETSQGR